MLSSLFKSLPKKYGETPKSVGYIVKIILFLFSSFHFFLNPKYNKFTFFFL